MIHTTSKVKGVERLSDKDIDALIEIVSINKDDGECVCLYFKGFTLYFNAEDLIQAIKYA